MRRILPMAVVLGLMLGATAVPGPTGGSCNNGTTLTGLTQSECDAS